MCTTQMSMKLFLAVAFGPDVSMGDVEFSDGGSVILVRAPSVGTAGTTAMDNLTWSVSDFMDGNNTVRIIPLGLPQEGEEELENSYLTILEYTPPAPPKPVRTTVFEGAFKRTAGPHAIQFVELLKKEIVKGLFNHVDPTDKVALMRKTASVMVPYWGLLQGALETELKKGGMPEAMVTKIVADLGRVPYGTNTYIWELMYVPEEGIHYFRLGAYQQA